MYLYMFNCLVSYDGKLTYFPRIRGRVKITVAIVP